ncbi:MAG: hypothetical protein IJQ81_14700 [Oscillibacter sp.]|nr:hypothetical protein [Oscillibacter sp.]
MQIYHAVPGEPLPLGHRYENNATRIVFDISAWVILFGPGTVRLLHQRPGDAAPYPVGVTRTDADGTPDNDSGTLVLWDVTSTDTAQAAHYGRAELRYYSGAEGAEAFLVKSDIYKTVVENALGAASDPPEEAATWLEAFMSAANQLETDAASALQAVSQTRTYQEAARIDAENAANSAQQARRAAEAAALITAPAAAGISFDNAANVALSDGGGFVTVVSGNFIAAAGTDVSVRASVGMSVATVATGSATGWTALSDATVTARCLFDESADGYREETFDSGARLMNMQFHFVPETDGRYDVRLQMRIAGGYAVIAQGGAALEVAGANYAPDI